MRETAVTFIRSQYPPTHADRHVAWIDDSVSPNIIKVWNGSEYTPITSSGEKTFYAHSNKNALKHLIDFSITDGGTGYVVGDTIQVNTIISSPENGLSKSIIFTVDAVSSGVVTDLSLNGAGYYWYGIDIDTITAALTGTGTGLLIDINFDDFGDDLLINVTGQEDGDLCIVDVDELTDWTKKVYRWEKTKWVLNTSVDMSTIIPVIESIVDSSIDEVSLTNSTDTAPSSSVVKKAIDDINSDLSTINTDLSNVKDTINDIGDPDNIIYNNDVVTANNSTKKISTVLSPNNESRILLSNSAFQVLSRNNNADAGIEIQPGLLYLYFMRMNPLSNYGLSLSNTGLLFRDVNNNTDILSVSPTVFKYNNKNVLTDGSGLLYNNTVVTAGNDPISINQVNTNTGNNSEINISNPYISLINVSNNNSNNIYLHPDKIELFSKDENYRHSFILNTDGISFRDDDNNIDVFTVSPTSIKYNDKDVLLSNNANIIWNNINVAANSNSKKISTLSNTINTFFEISDNKILLESGYINQNIKSRIFSSSTVIELSLMWDYDSTDSLSIDKKGFHVKSWDYSIVNDLFSVNNTDIKYKGVSLLSPTVDLSNVIMNNNVVAVDNVNKIIKTTQLDVSNSIAISQSQAKLSSVENNNINEVLASPFGINVSSEDSAHQTYIETIPAKVSIFDTAKSSSTKTTLFEVSPTTLKYKEKNILTSDDIANVIWNNNIVESDDTIKQIISKTAASYSVFALTNAYAESKCHSTGTINPNYYSAVRNYINRAEILHANAFDIGKLTVEYNKLYYNINSDNILTVSDTEFKYKGADVMTGGSMTDVLYNNATKTADNSTKAIIWMDGNDSSNFNIGNKLISISTRNGTNQNETNIISNSGDISLKAYSSTGRSTLILRPEYFRYNYGSPEETILDISNSEFQYKGKDVILSGDPNVIWNNDAGKISANSSIKLITCSSTLSATEKRLSNLQLDNSFLSLSHTWLNNDVQVGIGNIYIEKDILYSKLAWSPTLALYSGLRSSNSQFFITKNLADSTQDILNVSDTVFKYKGNDIAVGENVLYNNWASGVAANSIEKNIRSENIDDKSYIKIEPTDLTIAQSSASGNLGSLLKLQQDSMYFQADYLDSNSNQYVNYYVSLGSSGFSVSSSILGNLLEVDNLIFKYKDVDILTQNSPVIFDNSSVAVNSFTKLISAANTVGSANLKTELKVDPSIFQVYNSKKEASNNKLSSIVCDSNSISLSLKENSLTTACGIVSGCLVLNVKEDYGNEYITSFMGDTILVDGNFAATDMFLTRYDFDELINNNPQNFKYGVHYNIIDEDSVDPGFMMTPDYENIETINRISTNNGTWTADRSGFIHFHIWAKNAVSVGAINLIVTVDGNAVGITETDIVYNKDIHGLFENTIAITKGQTVSLIANAKNGASIEDASFYCKFIPPKIIRENVPVVAENFENYIHTPDYNNAQRINITSVDADNDKVYSYTATKACYFKYNIYASASTLNCYVQVSINNVGYSLKGLSGQGSIIQYFNEMILLSQGDTVNVKVSADASTAVINISEANFNVMPLKFVKTASVLTVDEFVPGRGEVYAATNQTISKTYSPNMSFEYNNSNGNLYFNFTNSTPYRLYGMRTINNESTHYISRTTAANYLMSLLGGVSVIKVYFPETNRILDLNIWHNPANNGAIMWEYR